MGTVPEGRGRLGPVAQTSPLDPLGPCLGGDQTFSQASREHRWLFNVPTDSGKRTSRHRPSIDFGGCTSGVVGEIWLIFLGREMTQATGGLVVEAHLSQSNKQPILDIQTHPMVYGDD